MMIKFFPRGRGGGRGPTEYLTKEMVTVEGKTTTRHPAPEVLRGNVADTRALIDTCQHKNKYTSGVIAFAAGDAPTEAQQQQVMNDFERLAFAGMEPDQYNILWVRHTHEGNTELHMVVPRLELISGKALNIAPPGHHKFYDELRDSWNWGEGWARPDDPARARAYTHDKTFGKEYFENRATAKTEISEWIAEAIAKGKITNRAGVLAALGRMGEITRVGKDYISVKPPGLAKALRLKGAIYAEEFDVGAVGANQDREEERPRTHSGRDPARAGTARGGLEEWICSRAIYNQNRYRRPSGGDHETGQRYPAGPDRRLGENRFSVREKPESSVELDTVGLAEIQPAGAVSLGDYLRRELGPDAVAIEPDHSEAAADQAGQGNPEQSAPGRPVRGGRARQILSDLREKTGDFRDSIWRVGDRIKQLIKVGYDRARDEINRVVEAVRSRIESAGESFAGAGADIGAAGDGLSSAGAEVSAAADQTDRTVQHNCGVVERGVAAVRDNRNDELEQFKTGINLAEYAAALGYQIDRRESSRNSAVMRRESDNDKIIIATDTDGHGVYFSVRDDADNGSIIDFVQSRQRLNLGQVRKELRPWVGVAPVPLPERICKPEPTSSDRRAVIGAFAQAQPQPAGGHPYLLSRSVSADTLADSRFAGMIRQDSRGNAVFPHYDSAGLSGYELKNEGFTGFSRGGEKRIWHSANIDEAMRVVVVESAIDALSHAQISGDPDAAYISVGGHPSPEQWVVLEAILLDKNKQGAALVVGTDADAAGDKLAEQIAALLPVERERPQAGDWNEQLQQTGLQVDFRRNQRDQNDYEGPGMG